MAIIELDQLHDTPVTVYQRGSTSIRYAYTRSKDSVQEKERGQDYLLFRSEPKRVVFAVCDGVGNSFFGGIGAQVVGEGLVSWLWKLSDREVGKTDNLVDSLTDFLTGKTNIALDLINRKNLEKFDNEFQKEAYKNQITDYGTQTNFVCGLIDIPSDQHPKGQVTLFWLGDAKLQIWKGNEAKTNLLSATWDSKEGWSSNKGVIGRIHSYITDLSQIDCVIAHTDGLNLIESKIQPNLRNEALQKAIEKLQTGPKSDDISFLQIHISSAPVDLDDDLSPQLRLELSKAEALNKKEEPSRPVAYNSVPTLIKQPRTDTSQVSLSRPVLQKKNKFWQYIFGGVIIIILMVLSFISGINYPEWNSGNVTPTIIQPTRIHIQSTPQIMETVYSILTEMAPTSTPEVFTATPSVDPSQNLDQVVQTANSILTELAPTSTPEIFSATPSVGP